jgi:hypothetical protein
VWAATQSNVLRSKAQLLPVFRPPQAERPVFWHGSCDRPLAWREPAEPINSARSSHSDGCDRPSDSIKLGTAHFAPSSVRRRAARCTDHEQRDLSIEFRRSKATIRRTPQPVVVVAQLQLPLSDLCAVRDLPTLERYCVPKRRYNLSI